jgi:hypothetical protein
MVGERERERERRETGVATGERWIPKVEKGNFTVTDFFPNC